MIAWVVIDRRYFTQRASCEGFTQSGPCEGSRQANPFASAPYSFISIYFFCLPPSVFSSKFRIPQLLCLALLRKLPGCVPTIPNVENSQCTRKELSARVCIQVLSFQILAHSFAPKKTQLLPFQPIPHSLLKNTGGGVPTLSSMWPRLIASKVE